MAIYTKYREDMSVLAYEHREDEENLVYNQVFPAVFMPMETGTYRELDERAYNLELEVDETKYTVAKTFSIGDSMHTYQIFPIARAFEFSNADLAQARLYGKNGEQEMIAEMQGIISTLLKKVKEKAFYTAITTDANFEGATYYNNAATAWSSTGLADMKDDILAARLVVKGLREMVISDTSWIYAEANATMNASTTVSGSARDGGVNPNPVVAFLENYFGMRKVHVALGDLNDDSSDPTETGNTEIWGDTALLLKNSPSYASSPRLGSWMKHLCWRPMGRGEASEGWIVLETKSDEEGGVGMRKFATWNYYSMHIQEKSYAYRIDAIY